MSELIIVNPGAPSTGPVLGLNIINEQPVRVFREAPGSPVIVTGSPGRDVIQVASFSDNTSYVVNADVGDDQITTGLGNDQIDGGPGNDLITAGAGNDTIAGGPGDDSILGGNGNDQTQSDDGIDIVDAGAGNDQVDGGQGNDTLLGGPGNDQVEGGIGEDNIRGGDGRDILSGGAGSDNIRGGRGNDVLSGGAGRDVLKGGFGRDTFRFTADSVGSGQVDRIIDFNADDDRIELSRALLPGSQLGRGRLSSENFEIVEDLELAPATATLVYEQKTGIVYYNPADGRDVPLLQLRSELSGISAANFVIT